MFDEVEVTDIKLGLTDTSGDTYWVELSDDRGWVWSENKESLPTELQQRVLTALESHPLIAFM